MKNTESAFFLELPGERLLCRIRYSQRAKNMRLRVLPCGELEIVTPPGITEKTMYDFAFRNQSWILRTMSKIRTQQKQENRTRLFPESLALDYLGGDFPVRYEWKDVSWIGARCDADEKTIFVTGNCLDPRAVYAALGNMLKHLAKEFIFPNLMRLAKEFDFLPGKLSIRLQKGRWGSCSSRGGAISLNAFLMMMPEDIVEYILIHELCHLKEMNHSPAFWKQVSEYCPDWKKRRGKLRKLEKERHFVFEQIHQNQ